jgi:starch synthase
MLDYQLTEQRNSNKQEHQLQPPQAEPTVALLHCMDLIDDFLDHINWSLETFCNEFTANWMYGYTQALQRVGVRTVIFCISARVSEPSRFKHVPTGSTICVIPASKSYLAYRALRRRALSLYGGSKDQSFKDISDASPTRRSLLTGLKNLAQSVGSYQATPLGLLAQELKREGCSAILCQEYEYPRFDTSVLLGRLTGLPVFATFQGGDEIHSWLEYPFRRLAFWGCSGLIIGPQTEIGRVQSCYGVPDNKIARIFNPWM